MGKWLTTETTHTAPRWIWGVIAYAFVAQVLHGLTVLFSL